VVKKRHNNVEKKIVGKAREGRDLFLETKKKSQGKMDGRLGNPCAFADASNRELLKELRTKKPD